MANMEKFNETRERVVTQLFEISSKAVLIGDLENANRAMEACMALMVNGQVFENQQAKGGNRMGGIAGMGD